jgi:hypothetical protein
MLKSSVNWGQYSDDRQAAYDRVADARQKKLDAEVQAKRERDAQGSDSQQLGALVVQGGLAYATGGASLAYAPMIDKASWTAMGKPQAAGTGISGAASSLGQVGYGLASANKAEALADADKSHERDVANLERLYTIGMESETKEGREQAQKVAMRINQIDTAYGENRGKFKESGFLGHLFPDKDDPIQGPSHGLPDQQTPQDIEMANIATQKQELQDQQGRARHAQGLREYDIRSDVDNRFAGTDYEQSVSDIVQSTEETAKQVEGAEVDPVSLEAEKSPTRGPSIGGVPHEYRNGKLVPVEVGSIR